MQVYLLWRSDPMIPQEEIHPILQPGLRFADLFQNGFDSDHPLNSSTKRTNVRVFLKKKTPTAGGVYLYFTYLHKKAKKILQSRFFKSSVISKREGGRDSFTLCSFHCFFRLYQYRRISFFSSAEASRYPSRKK